MFIVKYNDYDLLLFKSEKFKNEEDAIEFAMYCVNFADYDKAIVYNENNIKIAEFQKQKFVEV